MKERPRLQSSKEEGRRGPLAGHIRPLICVFHCEGQEKKWPTSEVNTGLGMVIVFHHGEDKARSCALESITEQGKGNGKGERRSMAQ